MRVKVVAQSVDQTRAEKCGEIDKRRKIEAPERR